jgi:hypothetical protein
MSCTAHQTLFGRSKDDKTSETCSAEVGAKYTGLWLGNLYDSEHLLDQGTDGGVMNIKTYLKELGGGRGLDLSS